MSVSVLEIFNNVRSLLTFVYKNSITGDVPTVADPTVADFRPSTQVGRFFENRKFLGTKLATFPVKYIMYNLIQTAHTKIQFSRCFCILLGLWYMTPLTS